MRGGLMKIKIADKTFLNSDGWGCWITKIYISEKTGKDREQRVSGYYKDFKGAIESYIEQKIKSSEATKLSELNKEVKALIKEVRGWKDETKN